MSITRVRYRERQRLTTADLRLEQDYRLAMAGRHHVSHHQWGVVRGLRVLRNEAAFVLTPGVAIDGYGREIFVAETVPLDVDSPDACSVLALYYCEGDAQTRPRKGCEDVPAPRIAQRFAWVLALELDVAAAQDDIERARAAGRFVGEPTWPVPVARVGRGCFPPVKPGQSVRYVDYGATRYVRHRAATIRAPHGRAVLQLGLAGHSDVHHLLLSTRDSGALNRRIGVDRDGIVHVWRELIIAGGRLEAHVLIAAGKELVLSVAAEGAIGARARFEGVIDPLKASLSASLIALERGARAPIILTASSAIPDRGGRIDLAFERFQRATVTLQTPTGRRLGFRSSGLIPVVHAVEAVDAPVAVGAAQPPSPAPPPAPAMLAFVAEARPTGGQLLLFAPATAAATAAVSTRCDDVARTRQETEAQGGPVVEFRPALDLEADPLSREIHAVITSKPTDMVPKTELRISGGAEDESDTSSRVCIGTSAGTAGKWVPVLRMDGGRRLDILAVKKPARDPLLKVEGTLYLPPIGKKDPLLPDLLALAFINGLRQIGKISPNVTLEIKNEPAQVTRGTDLTYTVHVEWAVAVQVKRCVEIVTGTEGNGDMAFRTITTIDLATPPPSHKQDFPIPFKRFTHTASKVQIQIRMLVARGTTTAVAVATSKEISVL